MFNIGSKELLLILLVTLLLFGAKRIPEVARALGKGLAEFRDAMTGVERELRGEPPVMRPLPPLIPPVPSKVNDASPAGAPAAAPATGQASSGGTPPAAPTIGQTPGSAPAAPAIGQASPGSVPSAASVIDQASPSGPQPASGTNEPAPAAPKGNHPSEPRDSRDAESGAELGG